MVKALRASNDLPLPKVRKIVEESIKDARKNESISVEEAKKLREMGSRDAMYSPKLSDFVYPRLKDELPSRANIIPVFVRAENPFDFQNPQHLKRLQEHLDADYFNNIYSDLKSGDWQTIEAEDIQEAIQLANFDGFYVKEGGRKNLAVYEPTQLKSATGNQGTFDIKNPDIRYSLPRLTKT